MRQLFLIGFRKGFDLANCVLECLVHRCLRCEHFIIQTWLTIAPEPNREEAHAAMRSLTSTPFLASRTASAARDSPPRLHRAPKAASPASFATPPPSACRRASL